LFFIHKISCKAWEQMRLMLANVRRYVALAQSRGGACFCTRGAM